MAGQGASVFQESREHGVPQLRRESTLKGFEARGRGLIHGFEESWGQGAMAWIGENRVVVGRYMEEIINGTGYVNHKAGSEIGTGRAYW